jgi:hypothetical protein
LQLTGVVPLSVERFFFVIRLGMTMRFSGFKATLFMPTDSSTLS